MRRDHRTRIPFLATALTASLLIALAPPRAEAADLSPRSEAALLVRAHEKARARTDRLRGEHAPRAEMRSAERHRWKLRGELWDLLRTRQRANGDPVAVDPSGRAGACPVAPRREKPAPRTASRPAAWTAPTRNYRLSAGYRAKGSHWVHRHTGQDFAVPSRSPVHAVGPGTVWATTCGDGFGNQILVRHSGGYFTQYAHLSRMEVSKGQRVRAGQRIALSGATGNVTGPHLHFEVRVTPYLGSAIPPLPWLRERAVRVGE
ncbi:MULTISPECIES: M23 family metallopeptidase [unclassified Streptomyces]|uniref:M23 family metallopeptidase n=1 Tax=unclassified Streptomyces TaxID=2593676 RepID=UPI003806F0B4